jgi:hypothetical protein
MSCSCILVGSSIVMVAACAPAPPPVQPWAPDAGSPERGRSDPPEVGSDERGIAVESAPFTVQIGLHIHGSREGPLSDGDTVMTGDHIQVFAQTTEDAHMYLAFCAEDRSLFVFPAHGSIATPAGTTTVAPGKDASLVVDDHLGSETLYVILSRADLVSTDPRLAGAIRAPQSGQTAADCGPGFLRGADRRPPQDPRDRPRWIGRPDTGAPGDPSVRHTSSADDDEPPVVTIERGMFVGQDGSAGVTASADANGIAILRYWFKHVAAARPNGAW